MSIDEAMAKVSEAYKTSPMLTALLVLNVLTLVGGYYHINRIHDRYTPILVKLEEQVTSTALECIRLQPAQRRIAPPGE